MQVRNNYPGNQPSFAMALRPPRVSDMCVNEQNFLKRMLPQIAERAKDVDIDVSGGANNIFKFVVSRANKTLEQQQRYMLGAEPSADVWIARASVGSNTDFEKAMIEGIESAKETLSQKVALLEEHSSSIGSPDSAAAKEKANKELMEAYSKTKGVLA